MEDQLFYVGQKALIIKDNKILVLYKSSQRPDLPGGKIQIGEYHNLTNSLKREIREETNLEISVGDLITTGTFQFTPDILQKEKKATDLIFIVVYVVKQYSGEIILSDEHTSYKWIGKEDYDARDKKKYY